MVGQKAFPVTTTKVPETVRLSQQEALERAGGDEDLTRRLDERTVLVLNFPGQKFGAAARAEKRRTRVKS